MNNWLFSIFLIALLSYIVKIILPSGKTKLFLIFLFSISTICAIIQPIKEVFNQNYNFELPNTEFSLSQDYINSFWEYREKYYLASANAKLSQYGIEAKEAIFVFDDNISGKPLKKIKINYDNIVIIGDNKHINITSITKKTLSDLFLIEEDSIEINGYLD